MPARIFILSVVIIGLAFLVVPAARYLIWGPELDSESVSVPNDSESGAVRELEVVRLLGKGRHPRNPRAGVRFRVGGRPVDVV